MSWHFPEFYKMESYGMYSFWGEVWFLSLNVIILRLIRAVLPHVRVYSLLLGSPVVQIHRSACTHSPIQGHLTIMTNAAVNICIQVFCSCRFLFYLGKELGVGLLDFVVSICLTLKETAKLFSREATHFTLPPADFQLLPILSTLAVVHISF